MSKPSSSSNCEHKRRKYVTIGRNGTIFDCQEDHCRNRITMNEIKNIKRLIQNINRFFPCDCAQYGMPTFDYETVEAENGNFVSLRCFHCNDVVCFIPDNREFKALLTTGRSKFGSVFEERVVTNIRQLRPGDEVSEKIPSSSSSSSSTQFLLAKHYFIVSQVDIANNSLKIIEVIQTRDTTFLDFSYFWGKGDCYKVLENTKKFVKNEFTKYHYLPRDAFSMEETLSKARESLGQPFKYGVLINNCQHFSNQCKFGRFFVRFYWNQADYYVNSSALLLPIYIPLKFSILIGQIVKNLNEMKPIEAPK